MELDASKKYVIESTTVVSGGTLTIPAGTTIKFYKNTGYLKTSSNGIIKANGTEEAPVKFTTYKSKDQAAGDWDSVQISGTSGSVFKYCIFEYGKDVLQLSNTTTVDNCTFVNNK